MLERVWLDVFTFEKWVVLLIFIASLLTLFTVYRTSVKPTLQLSQGIRSYAQNPSADRLYEELERLMNRGDEIGMLAGDIRRMIEQKELYYQQKLENEELKTKILIAQIKPHFIYNCLTVIRSFLDEPEKAEDALNHYAGFLRGSVDLLEETECIRADREFHTVDNYLYMQKQRFEDQLTVVTEYQDVSFFLPAFSVQILVENAVDHGIRGTPDGCGTVSIRSYEKDGFHVIEVEDDGVGMPTENRNPTSPDDRLHVGLRNIEKRLKLMCGGTLSIESEEGKGTKATIRIPG
jgi:sensor histidine kinase YesM